MILDRDKKPPEPYRHQDYPGLRYKETGEYVKVGDATEDAAAEARGYTKTPPEPGVEAILAPPGALTKPGAPAKKK